MTHGVLDEASRPCGAPLSLPHAQVLLVLGGAEHPMKISELAEYLSIDRSNVSRHCARMEKDGELVREPHPEDGRARVLVLTEKGVELAEHVDRESAAHFERVVGALGEDASEVLGALRRFHDALLAV